MALPPHLSTIYPVFHISVLRRYILDPSHIIDYEEIELQLNLSYEEQALRILNHQEKKLRNKIVKLVRVQWKRRGVEESTWELEDEIRSFFRSPSYLFWTHYYVVIVC